VAQPLTAEHLDSLPLYRQSEMLTRQGVQLDRSRLLRWTDTGADHLEALYAAPIIEVMGSAEAARRRDAHAHTGAEARQDQEGQLLDLERDRSRTTARGTDPTRRRRSTATPTGGARMTRPGT
jgi:hypothetical protein